MSKTPPHAAHDDASPGILQELDDLTRRSRRRAGHLHHSTRAPPAREPLRDASPATSSPAMAGAVSSATTDTSNEQRSGLLLAVVVTFWSFIFATSVARMVPPSGTSALACSPGVVASASTWLTTPPPRLPAVVVSL